MELKERENKTKKRPRLLPVLQRNKLGGQSTTKSSSSTPTLAVLSTTLTVLVATIDGIPAPGLKGALGGLLAIIQSTKLHNQNIDALEELESHLRQLVDAILKPLKEAGSKTLSRALQDRVTNLITQIASINHEIKSLGSSGRIARFFRGSDDSQVIQGLNARLKECLDRFLVEGAITQTLDIDILKAHAEGHIIDKLPRAHAGFNSKTRNSATKCFNGTRVKLLCRIYDWIDTTDLSEPRIFWLNGLAGTGKTTIAHTVAERCHSQNFLGASFFFSRDVTDRSNSQLVFTTIAHQLATFNPAFKNLIARALEAEPDAGHANIPTQLQHLIIQPLRLLPKSTPTIVVVMDALDECSQEKDVSDILKLLATELRTLPFTMKFFITSRPEHQIRAAFESELLRAISKPFILHDIETSIVHQDIEVYLSHRLKEVASELLLGRTDWPAKDQLRILADRASGLFIFASTAVRFIEDENYDDPVQQLNVLIESGASESKGASPFDGLDLLYTQVLAKALPETAAAARLAQFQLVVGSIILLFNPLPLNAIENLLQMEPNSAKKALLRLHSLLAIPSIDTDVPRVLHPSFQDYLTDPRRCTLPYAYIDSGDHHGRLARTCFDCMKAFLRRDICKLGKPPNRNSDIDDLPARVKAIVSKERKYACLHWAMHLSRARLDDSSVVQCVEEFAYTKFLFWLEFLSLTSHLHIAIPCIKRAQLWLARASPPRKNLLKFFNDAERLVLKFYQTIADSALHIYYSALPFVPSDTMMYKIYSKELDDSIALVAGGEKLWNPLLRTIEGHEDQVRSVAFSSDGTRIVSGSWDFTVRIWDALTGASLSILKGHQRDVKAATFSPDGIHIASASEDETVRLWDASTGTELAKLVGHDRDVTSVAFASDMVHLVSGSEDATVRIWDWPARKLLVTLTGHQHYVRSVNYSHDANIIVSGSEDSTVRMWDAHKHLPIASLNGHTGAVLCTIFSPDSSFIISGGDETVRIWDTSSHQHIATLSGHASHVTSVAISPDGSRIISGSNDQTVKLWDVSSSTLLNTFTGHLTTIWSVAFSPDGTRCASGSGDRTVRLWDTSTDTQSTSWINHASYVTSVAYSPPGTLIASGSENGMLQIWDALTKLPITTIHAHTREITSLAFSPDGMRIATASGDKTVRLWGTADRKPLTILNGHVRLVRSVAFSSDGGRLVTGSEDTTIKTWNSETGQLLLTIDGHSSYVMSVAFSTNGTRIVSGSEDASVRVWDSITGDPLMELRGHLRDVMGVSFSPNDAIIVSASEDKTLRLWSPTTGQCLRTFSGHNRDLRAVTFSKDSKRIATGSEDLTVRLWDTTSGLLGTLEGHTGYVRSVAFSPDIHYVISGSEDGTVRMWDTVTFTSTVLESHSSAVTCACFAGDDSMAVLGTKDGTVQLWSMTTGALLASLIGHTRYITCVAFSSDHHRSASGSGDMTVRIWDTTSHSLLRVFDRHTNVVTKVAFSTDSTHILSWAGDAERHWDITSGEPVKPKRSREVWNLGAPQSYDLTDQWLTHDWHRSKRHTICVPWEFRGHVWPSRTSRILVATNQDKVVIMDFGRAMSRR
ncbi:hypothetical protein H0H92_011557 [Tricholoma furcatifolium]|nr:hypothetical protein H0H92_011557 [Tricholoma furcatifolium]